MKGQDWVASYDPGTCWYDALSNRLSSCRFVLSGTGSAMDVVSFTTLRERREGMP